MSAYKDNERGTWYASFKIVDISGNRKTITKRGFATKREAIQYETNFIQSNDGRLTMTFGKFVEEHYLPYIKSRIKQSTFDTKVAILKKHILPYFQDRKLTDITNNLIIQWQNKIMSLKTEAGETYSQTYLKTIHLVLSAILNFGVKNFGIPKNAAALVGAMGSNNTIKEMEFWTLEEYKKVRDAAMEYPVYFYAFEVLYWTGMREGEMLALTQNDIDFQASTIRISKTFHRAHDEDIITTPKTANSNRIITIPKFLTEELKDYINQLYDYSPSDRLFKLPKSSLTRKLDSFARKAEVKEIRVHDLRHSHVSLLIDQGYTALAIAKRVGHKAIDITYRYSHLFPHVSEGIATTLDGLEGGKDE